MEGLELMPIRAWTYRLGVTEMVESRLNILTVFREAVNLLEEIPLSLVT